MLNFPLTCRGFSSVTSRYSGCKYPRVVVTGLGIVCPLGVGVQYVWSRLLEGLVGTTFVSEKDYCDIPCKVAAFVPKGSIQGHLNLSNDFKTSEIKSYSLATIYGLAAAKEALQDAEWFPECESDCESTGVAVGTGMVDLHDIINEGARFSAKGYSKVSPYFIPRILANMTAGHLSIKYGLKGPNHTVSTACAAGAHAIGDAFNFIKLGHASVMVCGSTEAVISPLSLAAFSRIRALSTNFNSSPSKASRPFDKERDGFVMGEGAGILVLESLEHAISRNAKIYAEILGYGLSGDAYQIAAPAPGGKGAYLCMASALQNGDISPSSVGYVNAHATSTPLGDASELKAIKRLFGLHSKNLFVSSTKGATGHLLGAAGSIEAIFTVLSCHTGQIPPTANLLVTNCETDVQLVSQKSILWPKSLATRNVALTNSFGFGGTNASLIFSSFDQ